MELQDERGTLLSAAHLIPVDCDSVAPSLLARLWLILLCSPPSLPSLPARHSRVVIYFRSVLRTLLRPSGSPTPRLPLVQILPDLALDLLGPHTPAERVNKLPLRIHEVEEDGVIDKVIVRRERVRWRREVDAAVGS